MPENNHTALHKSTTTETMPLAIYILGFGIFSMTTSEFMVAGLMPALSAALNASVAQVGYLITLYALGMMIGGPLVSLLLLNWPKKRALMTILMIFFIGQALGAMATNYLTMAIARVITGVVSSAFFGIALSTGGTLVKEQLQGRAFAIILGGLMVATVFGMPMATLIDLSYGWRASFWAVALLVLLAGCAVALFVPEPKYSSETNPFAEFSSLRQWPLWAAYATSALTIGAVFAAFSYFSPILINVSGFSAETVPGILMLYGAATVMGNIIIGRYANRFTIAIQTASLLGMVFLLVGFALFSANPWYAVSAILLLGLIGLPTTSVMAVRVTRAGGSGPLVATIHASIVNLGLAFGTWSGGIGMDLGASLSWPLWCAAGLAVMGLLSLIFIKSNSIKPTQVSQNACGC